MMKAGVLWILFLLIANELIAQDIHFSQYYASPTTENPANCGFFDGKYRLGANYRNQWGSVSVPFVTSSAYFDMKLKPTFLNLSEWLGVGISAISDKAGDGNLHNQRALLGLCYHKSLDGFDRSFISLGFSGGLGQKTIDFEELYFGNQWDGLVFDKTESSREYLKNYALQYFDMNMGIMASFKPVSAVNLSVGYAMFHLNRPDDSFSSGVYPKKLKHLMHAKATVGASDRILVEPSFLYTWQANAKEVIVGSNVVYSINENAIYGGLWYRLSGDLSPVAGLVFSNMRLLISYDINLSKLKPASKGRGGPELSLVYIFRQGTGKRPTEFNEYRSKKFVCPSF